jgi:antitoxin component YwqK of YwqJK toxin-antitoxin module
LKNGTVFETRGRVIKYEDTKRLTELTSSRSYFIFIDKRNKKMMEARWTQESILGNFIFYYRNGQIKVKGHHGTGGDCGYWEFYNRKGKLRKAEEYSTCFY